LADRSVVIRARKGLVETQAEAGIVFERRGLPATT